MSAMSGKNVPTLRFPEFDGEWEATRIGKIGKFSYGKSAPKFSLVESGGTPCVRYGELYRLYGSMISEVVSQTSVPAKNLRFSKGGEILVPRVGEEPMDFAANSSYLPLPGIAIGEMISAFSTKEDPIFFTHYFRTLRQQFARVVEGGNVSNLYYSYLEDVRVGKPSRVEQQKIAAFLGAVDEKISGLEKKKALLDTYKRGVMQKLFSRALRFKDDQGRDFPDWEKTTIGNLGETFGGLSGKTAKDFGSGAPFVTYLQVFRKSTIDLEECGAVEIKAGERQNALRKGDILFSLSSETPSEVGLASVVMDEVGEVFLNSFCFGLRPRFGSKILPEFSQFLFRSPAFRHRVFPLAQGSTRYNLAKPSFLKLSISLPSPAEQQKIAGFLSSIDIQIAHVESEITQAKTFKKGLLQQMFV